MLSVGCMLIFSSAEFTGWRRQARGKGSPGATCRSLLSPCAGAGEGRCLLNAKEQQHAALTDLWSLWFSSCFLSQLITVQAMKRYFSHNYQHLIFPLSLVFKSSGLLFIWIVSSSLSSSVDQAFIVFSFDETVHLPSALLLPKPVSSLSSRSREGDERGFGLELASDEVWCPLGWRH